MKARLRALALGLAALAASAASAQQGAAPPRPAPARAPSPPAPPAPVEPQAGTAAAPAQPAPAPQPIRTEIVVHDGWTVTCREFADKRRTCSGTLQVVQSQNNQVVFVWILGKNAESKLMSVLQTPTGIALAPGVEVKMTRGAARKAVFVNCDQNRCEATLDADDAFIRDASASESVDATIIGTNGQGVKFTMPLKGFDKAVAALR